MSFWKRGRTYYIDFRWRDAPRMQLSTGTSNKALARAMDTTLQNLYREGRLDLLDLLKEKSISLRQLHDAVCTGPRAVDILRVQASSPTLGPLVEEWLDWLASPAGVSPRTQRRYAQQTVRRYRVSWQAFFEVLPQGREAGLADLTSGFVADYRKSRVRAEGGHARNTRIDGARPSPATINRDLIALGSFLSWCEDSKGLHVTRPKLAHEKEPSGLERWLSHEELRAVEDVCPEEWWPLFATLIYTGTRIGEAQGLRAGDVKLAQRRLTIHEGHRRLKTSTSTRDIPIPEPLAEVLVDHFESLRARPTDLVFPAPLNDYGKARRAWRRIALDAGLHDHGKKPKPTATIHTLRHSYGVHAAQAGVPIARLQKLMGHATPHMTLRYMKHAPEAYFAEDAARIADSLTGRREAEAAGRTELTKTRMKSV